MPSDVEDAEFAALALIGHSLGWRGSFTSVVVLAVLTSIVTPALIPSVPGGGDGGGSQVRHAFAPRVLAVLALNFLVFASL